MDQNTQKLIDEVLSKTKLALLEFGGKGKAEYNAAIKLYSDDLGKRLPLYFQNLAENGDTTFFLRMIAEEKDILESILLSFQMIAATLFIEALNRVRDIIISALISVLGKV